MVREGMEGDLIKVINGEQNKQCSDLLTGHMQKRWPAVHPLWTSSTEALAMSGWQQYCQYHFYCCIAGHWCKEAQHTLSHSFSSTLYCVSLPTCCCADPIRRQAHHH